MKKSLTLAGLVLFAFVANAQVQMHKTQSSYFMPFNWQFSYPGMFSAVIDPAAGTMTVTPLCSEFVGIVSISVHESLACGNVPDCVFEFEIPQSGFIQMPEGFMPCASEASPLFLKLCWWRKVKLQNLQMAAAMR
ncbi:MAG: hypothetical protein H6577_26955 [Lewinellaceae bacterium]|nr:hypothetical protein [Saprospiraceae bacterium]MCB9341782.1 hypothetical protein [Lewinellaceae bacterium]